MNKSQDKPLSLIEFTKIFGTEKICKEHLFNLRFADGFTCPKCGHDHATPIKTYYRMQCSNCRHQVSSTAGTMMENTKTDIQKWYFAIYLITTSKRGISATELQKQISVTYKTAWYINKRIKTAMKTQEDKSLLKGFITLQEMNFAIKRRSTPAKNFSSFFKKKVILAVSHNNLGEPMSIKMQSVKDFKGNTIEKFANTNIEKASTIRIDSLKAHLGQTNKKKRYFKNYYKMPEEVKGISIGWLETVISNTKAFFEGTFHRISKNQLQAYLTEFCYRFNLRNTKDFMFENLLISGFESTPIRYYSKAYVKG